MSLVRAGIFHDPAHERLMESRKAVVYGWLNVAQARNGQGESTLADEVRHFARHLPGMLTDRELRPSASTTLAHQAAETS
jgi:hypothetical protein